MLGIVIVVKILKQHRTDIFGETMMLLYYVYLVPLTMRIGRGFYVTACGSTAASCPTRRSAASPGVRNRSRHWSCCRG